MFIELHFVQHFAPANLNRDDANLPKDCDFGGARRARISSQCFKRALRTDPIFKATTAVENGTRTRLIVRELRKRLQAARKPETESTEIATEFARTYSSKKGKMDKDPERTAVMLYLSDQEFQQITTQ